MRNFADIWKAVCSEFSPDPRAAAGELAAAISDLLEVEQVEYSSIGRVALFLFDLSKLGFKGMDLNVVMITHPPEDDNEAREQAKLLSDYKYALQSVGFCFQITLSWNPPQPNPYIPSTLETVFICGEDLGRLFSSKAPPLVLFEVIRRQVQLQRLCPFNTTHEARGAMFKGRKDEIERLIHELDTNFIVSGARRIGKTSLLVRAYNDLRKRSEFRNPQRVYYFNCLTWGNYWDCFDRLAHAIAPRTEPRIEKSVRNISYMLERRSFRGAKPLILFFDELDRVVDVDAAHGWQFFSVLAEGVSSRWIRVVFAGYRSMTRLIVAKSIHSPQASGCAETPFHGSLEPLALKPLTRSEANGLITEPFNSIGVRIFEENRVTDRVWEGSAGSPFLLQFYGEQLYRRSSERSPQEVHPEDVDELEGGFELGDFLETHFLENTLDKEGPVVSERLCAFLYAHSKSKEPWTEGDFLAACYKVNKRFEMDDIHSALRNLIHANILCYRQRRYHFNFPLLRDILQDAYPDLPLLLKSLAQKS